MRNKLLPAIKSHHIRLFFRRLFNYTHLLTRPYYKAIFLIWVISLLNLYSVSGKRELTLHILTFIIGSIVAVLISNIDQDDIKQAVVPLYLFICLLVVSVSFIGHKINGARRWLKVGAITCQPTEFLKLALILIIALYLDARLKSQARKDKHYNLFDLLIPFALTIIPIVFVLKQPDLGTAVICLMITGGLLFFMGIEKRALVIIVGLLICGVGVGWKHLKPYQKDRVVNFLSPETDIQGKAWQAHQSLIAFSSGGLYGDGGEKGIETQLGYIPENDTDFALTSLGEERGFVGVGIVLVLVYIVVMSLISAAKESRDVFACVVIVGVALWIGLQAIVNAGMCAGLVPVIGIPFPVISYGSSSLLTLLLACGIIAGMDKRKKL